MGKIISTGSYLPKNVVSNDELIQQTKIDSSNEWITQRTGIHERRFADENETVADIATEAARNVLSKTAHPEVIQENIELIIVATMSANAPTPSIANQVQSALNNTKAWGFDLSGACSGFVMAMEVAQKMSKDKSSGYTLVIGAEKMSSILNFDDRSTQILFGDGAGAVLIENNGQGLSHYESSLSVQEDKTRSLVVSPNEEGINQLVMTGRDVFNFVNRTVIPSLDSFLTATSRNLNYLIIHQANQRLLDLIAKKVHIPKEKIPANIFKTGNLSAGSIPVLLDELVERNQIKLDESQQIVLSGFGGGLAWGHIYFWL